MVGEGRGEERGSGNFEWNCERNANILLSCKDEKWEGSTKDESKRALTGRERGVVEKKLR
jgi:hypothetical protein